MVDSTIEWVKVTGDYVMRLCWVFFAYRALNVVDDLVRWMAR
jgi:hypothetical protein